MTNITDNTNIRLRYTIAKNLAFIAVLFFLVLSLLLIASYIQTKSADPLNSAAISKLRENLRDNPRDTELIEQIRALDLLARKAYFTYQWQIETGSYLLSAFALVFFAALKSLSSLKRNFPDLLEKSTAGKSWEDRFIFRQYFAYGAFTVFILALLAGLFSEDIFKTDAAVNTTDLDKGILSIETIRENWPQFRGPQGNGIVYNSDHPPLKWDGVTGENILWKTTLPLKGFNSPVVWDGKIFLSGADDAQQAVFCFNMVDGSLLWQHDLNDIPGSPDSRPEVMDYTGYAAPTMTTDGENVFVIFGTGDIAAIDFTGQRKWAKNLGVPANHYGHGSSLAVYGQTLLVQYDQNTGGHLIGLDTRTGRQKYDQSRDIKISWASPILINWQEKTQVVLSANPSVISYDPENGAELWRLECLYGEIGPSPAFANGMVYACNDFARLVAIELGQPVTLRWESDEDLSDISSPVANENFVIMAASYGTVSCFDSKTGERYWYYEADDGFYASPLIAGTRIYLIDVNGLMHIIKTDKEFELLAQNPLGEKSHATPAFYRDKIFIRGEKNLFCIAGQD